jgi:hypothetical protein
VNTLVLGACLFPVGQLPDDYRTVKHLIDFDKAPDKARDKVYSTPGGALMSRYDPSAFGYLSRHVSALRPSNSDKKQVVSPSLALWERAGLRVAGSVRIRRTR